MNARRVTMAGTVPPSGKALPFRFLALVPAGLGLLALGVASLVWAYSLRQSEWAFLVLAALMGVLGAILFRCAYRVWRRTSASGVRELCGWLAFTSMALVSFIVERLGASGRDGLAWLVVLASIPVLVAGYCLLGRFLLARLPQAQRSNADGIPHLLLFFVALTALAGCAYPNQFRNTDTSLPHAVLIGEGVKAFHINGQPTSFWRCRESFRIPVGRTTVRALTGSWSYPDYPLVEFTAQADFTYVLTHQQSNEVHSLLVWERGPGEMTRRFVSQSSAGRMFGEKK